jgi:hypothetical protein
MTKLAGVDMLGYTYDVLGKYADAAYIQHLVVGGIQDAAETETFHYDNYEDAAYEYPATCSVQSSSPSSSSFQSEGSSYEEFSRETEAKLGVKGEYGGFSGSIDASFNENVKASSSYYYSSIFDTATGYTLRIEDEHLKLVDAVQADLDDPDLDPAELFARWGTHVVAGVVVGGQCRYWAYGSQSSYETLDEFSVNVEGSYGLVSGSSEYSNSEATKTEEVESSTGVEVLGGTTEGRTAVITDHDYAAWASTIPYQPAVIAFAPDLLVPLWDFCSDAARRDEVEAAFDELFVPRRGEMRWVYLEGSSSDSGKEVKTDDPDEIVVGFGGNVTTNNNLNRIGIRIENLRTGERSWKQNEDGDFEKSGEVPEGCALTGIALHVTDDTLKHLKLYYQRVNWGHSSNNGSALDREVYAMYVGGEHSGWDLDSATTSGNAQALGGFRIRIEDGKGKTLAQYENDFQIAGDQD